MRNLFVFYMETFKNILNQLIVLEVRLRDIYRRSNNYINIMLSRKGELDHTHCRLKCIISP